MTEYFFCAHCARTFEEAETRRVRAGTDFMNACPVCAGMVRRESSKVVARASYPLAVEMLIAYGFPFRPSSLALLVPMAVLIAFVCWSIHGLLLGLVCYGVLLAIVFAIVRATAAGEDHVTVDSMFAERGAAAGVVLRYLALVFLCLAPVLTVWALDLSAPFYALALLAGYLYFPAGLIAASQHAATWLDPLLGYRLIRAAPVPYLTAVLCMTPAAAVWLGSVFIAIVARICGILLREEALA